MSEALTVQKQQYSAYVERLTTQVIAALPISVPDEQLKRSRARFRVAFSADAQGALLQCSADSIARAIVLSAMSGLFPGGPKPDVYLIPRGKEVNWQISFRGYIRLARRAGWDLEPVLVYEGEEFKVVEGNVPSITHVRNLDIEPSWEAIRYGYIRVFREGQREQAKVGYLTKAQIEQRRRKAQTDNVWKEWPLEMALKTLCNYAGNREMFPLDDPARYAMEASEQAELGAGSAVAIGTSAFQASRSELLLDRLQGDDGREMATGAALEPEVVHPGPVQVADLREPQEAAVPNRDMLVEELRSLLKAHGKTGPLRDEALMSAFGDESWIRIVKLPAADLAVGLAALRRSLEGPAGMMEPEPDRIPGED